MARVIRFAAAVFCLLCVLAICIAPLVDLPATNLPSGHMVLLLIWCFIASAVIGIWRGFEPVHVPRGIWFGRYVREKKYRFGPLDTNCILRF